MPFNFESYRALCTEFYDLTKPEAGSKELTFYTNLFKDVQGPILEAMCGSGRVLIPLAKIGFEIEGVDSSLEMLASCKKRFSGVLYNQNLENLSLPKKYAAIFIAVGSFQLIFNPEAALKVLRNLHSHLLPGGVLILDTYIPDFENVDLKRKVQCADGAEMILHTQTRIDPHNQLEICHNHYEKWMKDQVIATEDEDLTIRWYQPSEMKSLLTKVGFSYIDMQEHSFAPNEKSFIYLAV